MQTSMCAVICCRVLLYSSFSGVCRAMYHRMTRGDTHAQQLMQGSRLSQASDSREMLLLMLHVTADNLRSSPHLLHQAQLLGAELLYDSR